MNYFRKLFGTKKDIPVVNNDGFWAWFTLHQESFYAAVKNDNDVDGNFLDKLMPKLQALNEQFYCLTGMCDDDTVELVVTAEGDIKTFVFVEELIGEAPVIDGWKFTSLKPPIDLKTSVNMDGYDFNDEKISFFSNEYPEYPDEIDITLVHQDFNEENKSTISNGTLIYLDNAIGELNAATLIDNLTVAGNNANNAELIPIGKLNDFIQWREKEFVEKYKGIRRDTENDEYTVLEAQDGEGKPLLAVINKDLMEWDAKPSHPWMVIIEMKYTPEDDSGMPANETYTLMDAFEDAVTKHLPDSEGYLNLGRETYNGTRTIFFACKEFRECSKTVSACIDQYVEKVDISYKIFKDKYWMTMERFS